MIFFLKYHQFHLNTSKKKRVHLSWFKFIFLIANIWTGDSLYPGIEIWYKVHQISGKTPIVSLISLIYITPLISGNVIKTDAVYNSISTILLITFPPPKSHSTFSLNKIIAVFWIKINVKIQTSLYFFQALDASRVYIWGIFTRGRVQEVTGLLVS